MKKLLWLVLLFTPIWCKAQTYISVAPSITNAVGTLAGRSAFSLEVGRQWDVFSVGIAAGKTNLARVKGSDTALYFEVRPNLNVFQQGKFTNTITPGIGYVLNAQQNVMLEFTTGIEYACTPLFHFNIVFGQYYYSGLTSSSSSNFFGLSLMRYFSRFRGRALIKNPSE